MSAGKLRLKDSATGNIVTIAANYDVGDSEDRVILLPTDPGVLATDVDLNNAVVNLNAAIADSSSRVVTPIITSPLTGTEDFSGVITTSPFALKEGYESTHLSSDWEIAKDLNFTDIAVSSYNDTNNKTSFTFNPEESNTTYYIRVRHNSSAYVSKWSNPISVSSVNVYISSPEVTVDGNDLNTSLKPSFSSSPFTVINGSDTHTSTDWEISLNNNFTNIIFSNYDSNTNKLTLSLISNLLYGTEYYIRARYKGAKYTSAWSNIVTFRTSNKTDTPVLSGVSNIEEGKPVTINIMNYNSNLTYRVSTTLGSVSRNGAVLTLNTPNVTSNVVVIVSVVAVDSINQAADSDPGTHSVSVINIPTVADQALFYNATNIKSNFVKTTMDTGLGVLKPNHNVNILDSKNTSLVNKVYINNQLTDVEVGETLTAGDGELFTVSTVNDDGTVAVIEGVKTIACGYQYTVIVKSDGTLWATGNNSYGQLGLNNTTQRQVYTQVPNITNPKMIACSDHHTVIVKEDGTLWATGRNNEGQLGLNDTTNRQVYTQVPNIINPKMIDCGANYTVIVKSDGTLWATGNNGYGQLGLNDITQRLVYTQVPNITNPKMIACGYGYTVIVKSDGTLWGTGYNYYGQLGLNDITDRLVYTQVPNITNPKMIACGQNHTVIVKEDGTLWATGQNGYGQLGLNDATNIQVYTQVPNITNPKMISCGGNHTVIVKSDGTLLVTGRNTEGQLGLNDTTNKKVYTQVPNITNPKMISCGQIYTVIVKEDGTLWATGYNYSGQLGLNDTTDRQVYTATGIVVKQPVNIEYKPNYWVVPAQSLTSVPTSVFTTIHKASSIPVEQDTIDTDFAGLTTVSYKENVINVLDSKNTSTTSKIYINNILTDVNVGETMVAGNGELFTVSTVNDDGTVATIEGVKTIACGYIHTVIVKEDGTIWATGNNANGQLGLGDGTNRQVYAQVPTITNPKMISCGYGHTLIVKSDGTLWATGYNGYGQLGLNDTTDRLGYTQVSNITNPKMISCGYSHTVIVKEDGTLWATGRNTEGQLGLGGTTNRQVYTQVPNITNPKMISCGQYYTFIVKSDGTLWATGNNGNGQLGLNDNTERQVYTQVPNITNPKMISCGVNHTLIVKSDGTLWATGYNGYGQLGLNDTTNRQVYTQIPNITNPKMISCGYEHTVIVKSDGTLWATGSNTYGQLGLNDTTNRQIYTQVPNITNPKMISCGYQHTVIVKEDGTLWATGNNVYGQLGLNDTTQRNSFTATGITVKPQVDIEYKPNYYVEPTQPLSAPVTSVYNVSKVKFNDVEAIPVTGMLSNQVLTVTCQDVEFTPSRTIVTEAIVSKQNTLTEIVGSVTKLG